MDTINVHGVSTGLHPSVFKKYVSPMEAKALDKTGKELSKLTLAEVKAVEEASTVATK